jgi:hypothetical protein
MVAASQDDLDVGPPFQFNTLVLGTLLVCLKVLILGQSHCNLAKRTSRHRAEAGRCQLRELVNSSNT